MKSLLNLAPWVLVLTYASATQLEDKQWTGISGDNQDSVSGEYAGNDQGYQQTGAEYTGTDAAAFSNSYPSEYSGQSISNSYSESGNAYNTDLRSNGYGGHGPGDVYGQPDNNAYGQTDSNVYGQQDSNGYGQQDSNGYGQSNSNGYGQQDSNGYGQSNSNGYVNQQVQSNRYGEQLGAGYTGEQLSSGYTGKELSGGYTGEQLGGGYTGEQLGGGYTGEQLGAGYTGEQLGGGYAGEQLGGGYTGEQLGGGYTGEQLNSGLGGEQVQGGGYSGNVNGEAYGGAGGYGDLGGTGFGDVSGFGNGEGYGAGISNDEWQRPVKTIVKHVVKNIAVPHAVPAPVQVPVPKYVKYFKPFAIAKPVAVPHVIPVVKHIQKSIPFFAAFPVKHTVPVPKFIGLPVQVRVPRPVFIHVPKVVPVAKKYAVPVTVNIPKPYIVPVYRSVPVPVPHKVPKVINVIKEVPQFIKKPVPVYVDEYPMGISHGGHTPTTSSYGNQYENSGGYDTSNVMGYSNDELSYGGEGSYDGKGHSSGSYGQQAYSSTQLAAHSLAFNSPFFYTNQRLQGFKDFQALQQPRLKYPSKSPPRAHRLPSKNTEKSSAPPQQQQGLANSNYTNSYPTGSSGSSKTSYKQSAGYNQGQALNDLLYQLPGASQQTTNTNINSVPMIQLQIESVNSQFSQPIFNPNAYADFAASQQSGYNQNLSQPYGSGKPQAADDGKPPVMLAQDSKPQYYNQHPANAYSIGYNSNHQDGGLNSVPLNLEFSNFGDSKQQYFGNENYDFSNAFNDKTKFGGFNVGNFNAGNVNGEQQSGWPHLNYNPSANFNNMPQTAQMNQRPYVQAQTNRGKQVMNNYPSNPYEYKSNNAQQSAYQSNPHRNKESQDNYVPSGSSSSSTSYSSSMSPQHQDFQTAGVNNMMKQNEKFDYSSSQNTYVSEQNIAVPGGYSNSGSSASESPESYSSSSYPSHFNSMQRFAHAAKNLMNTLENQVNSPNKFDKQNQLNALSQLNSIIQQNQPSNFNGQEQMNNKHHFGLPSHFTDPNQYNMQNRFKESNQYDTPNQYNDPKQYSNQNSFNDPKQYSNQNSYNDPKQYSNQNSYNDPKQYSNQNSYNDPSQNNAPNQFNDPKSFNAPNNFEDQQFNPSTQFNDQRQFPSMNQSPDPNQFADQNPENIPSQFNDPNTLNTPSESAPSSQFTAPSKFKPHNYYINPPPSSQQQYSSQGFVNIPSRLSDVQNTFSNTAKPRNHPRPSSSSSQSIPSTPGSASYANIKEQGSSVSSAKSDKRTSSSTKSKSPTPNKLWTQQQSSFSVSNPVTSKPPSYSTSLAYSYANKKGNQQSGSSKASDKSTGADGPKDSDKGQGSNQDKVDEAKTNAQPTPSEQTSKAQLLKDMQDEMEKHIQSSASSIINVYTNSPESMGGKKDHIFSFMDPTALGSSHSTVFYQPQDPEDDNEDAKSAAGPAYSRDPSEPLQTSLDAYVPLNPEYQRSSGDRNVLYKEAVSEIDEYKEAISLDGDSRQS